MSDPIISPENPQLKRCTKCGELKPREAFSRATRLRDGLQYACKACNAAYHAANAERIAKQKREYNAANRERMEERQREYDRKYYAANRERIAERQRKYFQTDAGKVANRAGSHNRRAQKAGSAGTYTASDLASIRAAQTDKLGRLICWRCGKPITDTPELDHWIPLKHRGKNSPGNLHYMHAHCNRTKQAKHPFDIGRLL
jgi:hypothetical protein